ncbi:hypothetical protein AMTR_s00018p00048120 [Amborella trichopoda]|uniref:Uncharacterized protein n=1 Tax=Amborella trichopoda TaxID=13333 RepID=W1PDT9_AMBTC|nr:hypothetical protein AMTR_s00018p00048120 [Amborella trichopoda]
MQVQSRGTGAGRSEVTGGLRLKTSGKVERLLVRLKASGKVERLLVRLKASGKVERLLVRLKASGKVERGEEFSSGRGEE